MTRLFTDGAETGGTLGVSYSYGQPSSSIKHISGYSYYVNDTLYFSVTPLSEFYWRGWVYIPSTTSTRTPVAWRYDSTTLGGIITVPATRKLSLYTSTGTNVATSTYTYPDDTWFLLEVHVKIADSGGVIEIKCDGILDATGTFTGDTKPGANTTINNILATKASTGGFYIDDIALNNTSGVVDNSWCGDGHVIALVPNADGDSSDLVGSDGNSTSNYALVDDIPHDTDTTYVESSTGDDYDLYNLTASGLGATHVIQRVWTESIAKDTTTAGGQIKHVLKTNSSEYDSSAFALSTSYALQKGAEQLVNPQTGVAWTPAELDALQVGVKIVA